mgnify:CR=1 FL=1|jgi:FOG: Ankyrin repeat
MSLYESIASHDYPMFERLLSEGHDINAIYVYDGKTSLIPVDVTEEGLRSTPVVMATIVCASNGDDRFLRRLAEAGADVNTPTPEEVPPLEATVGRGSCENVAVRTLAELGADLNRVDRAGQHYLDRAIETRSALAFTALIESGADLRHSRRYTHDTAARRWVDVVAPAEYAVRRGDLGLLRKALDAGLRPDEAKEETFLCLACRNNYPELVRLLLERGADPNHVGRHDWHPPLSQAVGSGNPEIVRDLIAAGADAEPVKQKLLRSIKQKALRLEDMVSGRSPNIARLRLTLESGVSPDLAALTNAVHWGNAAALRELLRHCGNCCGTGRNSNNGIRYPFYSERFRMPRTARRSRMSFACCWTPVWKSTQTRRTARHR